MISTGARAIQGTKVALAAMAAATTVGVVANTAAIEAGPRATKRMHSVNQGVQGLGLASGLVLLNGGHGVMHGVKGAGLIGAAVGLFAAEALTGLIPAHK